MVSMTLSGSAMPPLLTFPDTLTVLSAASRSLLLAMMVTVPVLAVFPAAIVSSRFVLRVMSFGFAGRTGMVATVIVMSRSAFAFSIAVTVATPPSSLMDVLSSFSFTARSSSSVTSAVTSVAVSLA